MKKTLSTLLLLLVSTVLLAQNAQYHKAVAKYKTVSSLTATAVKTKHKSSVAKDAVAQGTLYVKKPSKVLRVINNTYKLSTYYKFSRVRAIFICQKQF